MEGVRWRRKLRVICHLSALVISYFFFDLQGTENCEIISAKKMENAKRKKQNWPFQIKRKVVAKKLYQIRGWEGAAHIWSWFDGTRSGGIEIKVGWNMLDKGKGNLEKALWQ